jgi:hypothetical protein
MARLVVHEPYDLDRSMFHAVMSDVWPAFDGMESRKGSELITVVLKLWYADTREVDAWAFGKRWALREAQLQELPVHYERNLELGAMYVRDWLPETEGRIGGQHWRDYVLAQPYGRKSPCGLVSIRQLKISTEEGGAGLGQWLAAEEEPGWQD